MIKLKLTLLLALGLYGICFSHELTVVTFPNNVKGFQSPDKRFLIFNEDHDGRELAHSLQLKDENSGESWKILDYGRHVDVSWSPKSIAFYVNDYSESDVTTCIIFILGIGYRVDLSELVNGKESKKNSLWIAHHKYITCKSWVYGGVIVSVAGYGDASRDSFESRYKFDLKEKSLVGLPNTFRIDKVMMFKKTCTDDCGKKTIKRKTEILRDDTQGTRRDISDGGGNPAHNGTSSYKCC